MDNSGPVALCLARNDEPTNGRSRLNPEAFHIVKSELAADLYWLT